MFLLNGLQNIKSIRQGQGLTLIVKKKQKNNNTALNERTGLHFNMSTAGKTLHDLIIQMRFLLCRNVSCEALLYHKSLFGSEGSAALPVGTTDVAAPSDSEKNMFSWTCFKNLNVW